MSDPLVPENVPLAVLLVQDNPEEASLTRTLLEKADGGFRIETVARLSAALERLALGTIDAALLDLSLRDSQGLESVGKIQARFSKLPIFLLVDRKDEPLALLAIRQGTQDCFLKDSLDGILLTRAIRHGVERKRAEEAMRETHETLSAIIQVAPLGISVIDGKENVRLWNPAAERIFGWKAHEALGHPLSSLVTPGRKDLFPSLTRRALLGETITDMALLGGRKDGSPLDLSVSLAPIHNAQGAITGAMAILSDITESKAAESYRLQIEEKIRQFQKMEAVGQLAGGIAHDFNNLLTAISGYAEFLRNSFEPDHANRGYTDEILKSAKRAAQLTSQLLAFSRRQVLQPKVLNLNTVVQGLEGLLHQLIGGNIELQTSLTPGLGNVKADQGQIERVIMNLAVNARDAMPRGGKLIVKTRDLDLDGAYSDHHGRIRTGPHVLLAVSDTGCGISEKVQARLFEPFFTTKDKGTGLGLATVYGIVKQSGGDIWVYSELDRGTSFKIYLPRVGQPVEPRKKDSTRILPRKGTETVLLAEDSDVVRRLLRELLLQNGYRLIEARHGEEALQLSQDHDGPIDLLITDMVMPHMNGRELAAKLAPLRPRMKVLYMSGYTEEAIARNGVIDPGTAFLEKPFSPNTLARKVRELLDARGA
jgi:PAS domain S-box-containing protein